MYMNFLTMLHEPSSNIDAAVATMNMLSGSWRKLACLSEAAVYSQVVFNFGGWLGCTLVTDIGQLAVG
jgi:hypothetical protein